MDKKIIGAFGLGTLIGTLATYGGLAVANKVINKTSKNDIPEETESEETEDTSNEIVSDSEEVQ